MDATQSDSAGSTDEAVSRQGLSAEPIEHSDQCGPASHRWAIAVIAVVGLKDDVKTIAAWGRAIGVSRGTLGAWCAAASVPTKASLDFARALRAVAKYAGTIPDVYNVFDIVDRRTMARLLERAGVSSQPPRMPAVDIFLDRQRFITCSTLIRAIREHYRQA